MLSLIWMACVIGAQVINGGPVRSRELVLGLGPLFLGILCRNAGRYIVTGSLRR